MNLLRLSGKKIILDASKGSGWKFEQRPGGWVIATDAQGKRHRLALKEVRGKLSFSTLQSSGLGDVQKQSAASGKAGASAASVEADLTAQFPGKVRKILVVAGASVEEGEPLLLVEAMKMEFAIKAPVAGRVKKILVTEAQQLAPGDRFVEFEVKTDGQK
jgi:biotin carboxyl carrier protein